MEETRYPGKGQLLLTGQVGDVRRESIQAAFSLVKSRAKQLGIDPQVFAESDVHIHVPSGGIPKDGPSVGILITTALSSLFSGGPTARDVAITCHKTLYGSCLANDSLKKKS